MELRALIVDDEERARNTLSSLIREFCPGIVITGQCSTVPEAADCIKNSAPDLVFLDIEMPEYNGFELFDFVENTSFEVIFVTAYDQFAIRAFEVSAVDYLLKPVDIDKLQKAIDKVRLKKSSGAVGDQMQLIKNLYQGEDVRKIALPMSDGLTFVDIDSIVLLEAEGAYTRFFFNDRLPVLVSKRLKIFEDLLENRPSFFRAHRSYLINLQYLSKYGKGASTLHFTNNMEVSISRDRKQEFENLLRQLDLVI